DGIAADDRVIGIGHADACEPGIRNRVALNQDVGIVGGPQEVKLVQQSNAAEALGSNVLHRVVLDGDVHIAAGELNAVEVRGKDVVVADLRQLYANEFEAIAAAHGAVVLDGDSDLQRSARYAGIRE